MLASDSSQLHTMDGQRTGASAGRIEVLSRQLTNAGTAEVALPTSAPRQLQADAADVYGWLVRDNVAMREAIYEFLKVWSASCHTLHLLRGLAVHLAGRPPAPADFRRPLTRTKVPPRCVCTDLHAGALERLVSMQSSSLSAAVMHPSIA